MSPCEMYGITLYVNSSSTPRVHAQAAAGSAADRTRSLVITAPVPGLPVVPVSVTASAAIWRPVMCFGVSDLRSLRHAPHPRRHERLSPAPRRYPGVRPGYG